MKIILFVLTFCVSVFGQSIDILNEPVKETLKHFAYAELGGHELPVEVKTDVRNFKERFPRKFGQPSCTGCYLNVYLELIDSSEPCNLSLINVYYLGDVNRHGLCEELLGGCISTRPCHPYLNIGAYNANFYDVTVTPITGSRPPVFIPGQGGWGNFSVGTMEDTKDCGTPNEIVAYVTRHTTNGTDHDVASIIVSCSECYDESINW